MTSDAPKRTSRLWLYIPFLIFAVLIAAYSAYWFWMRGELDKGIDQWIADERARGIQIEYASKALEGFPYRFVLKVGEPRIADPGSGLEWSGQDLQLIMQPWNFNHVIGRSPGRNALILRGAEPVTAILGPKSVASITWDETSVQRFAVSLDEANIVTGQGPVSLEELMLNVGTIDSDPSKVRLAVDAETISIPEAPPEAPWLGEDIDDLRLRVELANAPNYFLQRTDLASTLLPTSTLDLAQFVLSWGPLQLGAKGNVSLPYDTCTPGGVINVRLENTDPLVQALDEAGQLTAEIETGIQAVGSVSNTGGFAPITFGNGNITFLGQPVAELPRLCEGTATFGTN